LNFSHLHISSDFIRFGIDDVELGRVTPPAGGFYEFGNFASEGIANPWTSGGKMAPFDRDFYLILNVATGGTNGFFPDGVANPGGKPWVNNSPVVNYLLFRCFIVHKWNLKHQSLIYRPSETSGRIGHSGNPPGRETPPTCLLTT
jgi:hypothetical protein